MIQNDMVTLVNLNKFIHKLILRERK